MSFLSSSTGYSSAGVCSFCFTRAPLIGFKERLSEVPRVSRVTIQPESHIAFRDAEQLQASGQAQMLTRISPYERNRVMNCPDAFDSTYSTCCKQPASRVLPTTDATPGGQPSKPGQPNPVCIFPNSLRSNPDLSATGTLDVAGASTLDLSNPNDDRCQTSNR